MSGGEALAGEAGGRVRTAWQGSPLLASLGGGMRVAAAVLGVALVLVALAGTAGRAGAGLAALTAAELALSAALFRLSRSGGGDSWSRRAGRLCGAGGAADCDSVLHGPWAGIGKWSLASLGLAWAGSSLLLLACSGMAREAAAAAVTWIGLTYVAALPMAALLAGVQILVLRRICRLCMTVHAVVAAGAALALRALVLPGADGALDVEGLARAGAVHALLFLLVLGVVLPWIQAAGELRGARADVARARGTPLGRLAMALAAPAEMPGPWESPLALGDPWAPLRVEAHIHPLCAACGPVVEALVELAERHGERVAVQLHVVPRSAGGAGGAGERELRVALVTAGLMCGARVGLAGFWMVKAEPERWMEMAGRGVGEVVRELVGEIGGMRNVEVGEVESMAERARAVVEAAEQVAGRIRAGIPAVFVGGRYFGADGEMLEVLVRERFEMVVASVGAAPVDRSLERQLGSEFAIPSAVERST